MATKEIKSRVKLVAVDTVTISTNTTTNLNSIDTANFDLGVTFGFYVTAFNAGAFAVSFQESDDDSAWTAVPADYLIGVALSLAAATVDEAEIVSNGIISAKRYIRPVVVSTGASGTNTISCIAALAGELKPV
jgi:hypothetical protein